MKQKIVISDTIADEGIAVLNESKLFDVFYKPGITPDELMKELHTAHGLIVRSATKVTAELIDAAPELQVIARAGIGLDNVDIERATEKGIVVMNTPAGNTISTAEHTIAMLLSLVRQIPGADNSMKQGKWEKNRFQGTELRGKVIAVIGLGRVGLEVARRCKGLSMRVAGYDPFISKDSKLNVDLEFPDIDDIWRTADFITVHTPLNDQTKNLINKSVISKMKSSVRLINCARGGIINETDLYNALKNGEIAGAALDVFTKEPPSSLPPFHELANVVLTPHLGASTGEAQVSVAVEAAEIVAEFLTTGIARNSINLPSLDIHELAFLKPYIDLAEKIGRFLGSAMKGRIRDVSIFYSGDFRNFNLSPLTSSCIRGLLSPYTEYNVNFVNASFIARERGIRIQIGEDPVSHDYSHLISIRVTGDEGTSEVWGTVLGKQPWFVKYNEYLIDFIPTGRMVALYNNDVPNVIGNVGNFFGSCKINIANFHLARTKRGGKAFMVIEVDTDLTPEVIKGLKGLPDIIDAQYIVM